jgi:hypothetical protein
MQRVLMLSVSVVAMTWAANAVADSPNLKGEYGFTGSGACLIASMGKGFNPNLTPTDGSFGSSDAVEGIRTFNGDGTGKVSGTSMGITIPANTTSAESSNFQFSFTYTVNGDGSFTADPVPGTFNGTVTAGPRATQTYTISNQPTLTGLISNNGATLTAATLTPQIETIKFSNGDTFQRICHRSRVLIKLGNGGKDD